jgi:predicted nucleic acid-binding protein
MALICDTGGVYALYDADDAHHESVRRCLEAEPGPLFQPVILLAKIDYLLQARLGVGASLDFLKSIEIGAFTIVAPTADDLTRCRELIHQ